MSTDKFVRMFIFYIVTITITIITTLINRFSIHYCYYYY